MSDIVGKHLAGYSTNYSRTQIYLCTSADENDVMVQNIADASEVKALSPRAVGRTYMPAFLQQDGRWNAVQWGVLDIETPALEGRS